jgi:hypothetical protein
MVPALIPARAGDLYLGVCDTGGASQIEPVASDPIPSIAPGRYSLALVSRRRRLSLAACS